MKKSFKAFVKNAMVYALAASMLVSTPLTASASGLNGVFSISDGKDTWDYDENGNKYDTTTGTGTVTNTDTSTGTLADTDANIIGIVLDKENVVTSKDAKNVKLKAAIVFDGNVSEEQEAVLNEQIRWEVKPADEKATPTKQNTTDKLAIKVEQGNRTVCELNPKQGGEVKVVASILDTDYTATATVSIKEYAKDIKLVGVHALQYKKHTLDMSQFVVLDPETATDEITWSISTTVKGSATISNTGVVTFKKVDDKVTVTAVTEQGHKDSADIKVEGGNPATAVEIWAKADKNAAEETNLSKKTRAVDVGGDEPETSLEVKAVMLRKISNNETIRTDDADYTEGAITDVITWSSNKTGIVAVEGNGLEATLTPLAVGTAKITAKATSGKSTYLNVKVSATLTGLKITNEETGLYSGQTLQMNVKRTPEANKDALKWIVEKVSYKKSNGDVKQKENPNATINSKGVLTIKNLIQSDEEFDWLTVEVRVESKKTKDKDGNYITSEPKRITVKQSSIKSITVLDPKTLVGDTEDTKKPETVVSVGLKDNEKQEYKVKDSKKQTAYVPKTKVYTGKAESALEGMTNEEATASLKWVSSNAKVATVDQSGNVKAFKKGTTNITVSGINVKKNGKAQVIKATYKVTVKQPATSIKLNNTSVVKAVALNTDGTIKNTSKQTVSYKATLGPSGTADTVNWSNTGDATLSKTTNSKTTKLTIAKGTYDFGDEFTVTARATSGVSATATVQVLKKTYAVTIFNAKEDNKIFTDSKPNKTAVTNNYKLLSVGDSIEMKPVIQLVKNGDYFEAGTDNTEDVTYSMNKSGIVKIIDNEVYAVKAGTVKITAKTASGGKATLTVQVQ